MSSSLPASPVVLVVEDNWLLRDELADALRKAGWTVLEASSGQTALALLHEYLRIDLLVTDIHLGDELTGWDIAEAVRKSASQISVVYASGNPSIAERRVPGSVFLAKPLAIAELLDISRQLLGRDEARP